MFFNRKQYYTLSQQQFDEMKQFYEKLGFRKNQVQKLCKKCFSADIRVEKSLTYSNNWTFYRRSDLGGGDFFSGRSAMSSGMPMASGMPGAMRMAMRSAPVAEEVEDGLPAPVEMAEPIPTEPPQPLNTAETHNVPENESHSPLDNAQVIFSANVNTASWNYLRNRIHNHSLLDPSFVRMEEIINSYEYDLPKPDEGQLFGITAESGKCPWNEDHELLFLGFKGKKADKDCRQNLVLLVDVSGSMEDEWILTQMSIAAIISKLKEGDTLSIISYSDKTTTVAKQLDCGNMDKLVNAVMEIEGTGGCTYGSEGLENAYRYLQETFDENANNRIFIFTDGDFNFGVTSEGGLEELIYDKRKTGIYLSIVGYGQNNFKDNKMETLARNGNGNYTFVANPADILDELWTKLVSNLVTVAKDVKISVELNPALVSEYRLLGYDDRKLTQQEFHNTEKAVDGMGSEHNVAALIELKRGKAEQKYKGRFVNVSAGDNQDEIAFVEVHYKSPEGENLVMTKSVTLQELQQAKNCNMPAAALLASFGLMVKKSAYKGDMTKNRLLDMASALMKEKGIETPERFSHLDIIRKYAVND